MVYNSVLWFSIYLVLRIRSNGPAWFLVGRIISKLQKSEIFANEHVSTLGILYILSAKLFAVNVQKVFCCWVTKQICLMSCFNSGI